MALLKEHRIDAPKARVGVLADSHGIQFLAERAIEQMGEVDAIIFLGDGHGDFIRAAQEKGAPDVTLLAVRGNNDIGGDIADELLVDVAGARLYCTHGHLQRVSNGPREICDRAAALGCDVALYGHTHTGERGTFNNVLALNPGSVACPRDRKNSALVLEIENSNVEVVTVIF